MLKIEPLMDISIHDNRLLSYCVVAETKEITLHTVFDAREPYEYTDIVFAGVAGYVFKNDNFQTILFDIDEADATLLYEENEALFEQGQKYCWPGGWNSSKEVALTYLKSEGVRAFILSSSIGMCGWVLARDVKCQLVTLDSGGASR